MATFVDVFERKEVKYRLSARQHRAMLDALAGRMALDEYGCSRVCSLYYDTPERLLIERSLDKPLYKEKLRVRWYGALRPDGRVFVEIKKKHRGIVYKRRVGCSYAAAKAYLSGVLSYEDACARFPLPDPAQAAESLAPRSRQIAREVDLFVLRYEALRPSMFIACEREAYAPAAAVASEGGGAGVSVGTDDLRITFDARIGYRDLAEPVRGRHVAEDPLPLLAAGEAVMEVKAAGPFPLWLVRALNACEAYPASFSKYGEAYRSCMRDNAVEPAPALRAEPTPALCAGSAFVPVPCVEPAAARRAAPAPAHSATPAVAPRVASAFRFAPNHLAKKGGRCA